MRLIIESDKIIIDGIEYVPVGEKSEIKVGDIVKVTDTGKCYSGYHTWSGWKKTHIEYAIRYQYECASPNKNEKYIVRYIGEHEYGIIHLAIIENANDKKCYLIDVKGIERTTEDWG